MVKRLGVIETKVLKALNDVKDEYDIAKVTHGNISTLIGYGENGGGSISSALELLEIKGKICKTNKCTYKVLV